MARFIRKIRKTTSDAQPGVPSSGLLSDQHASNVIHEVAMCLDVRHTEIEDVYPCTPFQKSLFTREMREAASSVAQYTYALAGSCVLDRLQDAWRRVSEANSFLRTRIVKTDVGFVQVVLRTQLRLSTGGDMKTYLALDRERGMGLADPLLRLALTTEQREDDGKGGKKYYIVVSIQHGLYENWSKARILEQLEAAYNGASLPMSQPVEADQYLQGAHCLREDLSLNEAAQLDTATGFPPNYCSGHQSTPEAILSWSLDCASEQRSSRFTREAQLQTAWALVLHHFTSAEIVMFAVDVDERSHMIPSVEAKAGPALATVPCAAHVQPSKTIEDTIRTMEEDSCRLNSFEQVGWQNKQQLQRTAQGDCELRSLLAIRPQPKPSQPGLLQLVASTGTRLTSFQTFALTLECSVMDAMVELRFSYDPNAISRELARGLLHHFDYMFGETAHDLTRTIGQIEPISSGDVAQLTHWYHESHEPQLSGPTTVRALIERQCQLRAAATAVDAWDGTLSYSEVERFSSRLANHLLHEGVRPESVVPICFEKSKWLAVMMIAVMKAGAAFVLLDPSSQPLHRMKQIVQHVHANLILTSESLLSTAIQMAGTRSLLVAENAPCFAGDLKSASTITPDFPTITDRSALYVIFTSGSTGVPKGVVIEHLGYAAGALSRQRVTGLSSDSRVLQFSSCTFDTFITDILDTLIVGACICIPHESARHSRLAQVASEMDVTYADLVPSVARLLQTEDIPTLDTLVLSGEPVSRDDVTRWAQKVRLCNLYGPAECSAVATGHTFSGLEPNPSNIGRGCGGKCWIVSPANPNMLLPVGAVGELIVEGAIVGRGYLGNFSGPASCNFLEKAPAWRKKFPSGRYSDRMYKTGDLVQYQEDGTLLFIGRKDDQVKLHGQRLELGDVEHHLRNVFTSSKDAVAAIISTPVERLVAFILVDSTTRDHKAEAQTLAEQALTEDSIDTASLPAFRHDVTRAEKTLREHLPAYMVPTAYFPVQKFPRTSSGKINRARLQHIASELIIRNGVENYTAARAERTAFTDTEKLLQSIWSQVLDIEPRAISAENGFLDLGGDSIAAMRVVTMVASHDRNISATKLFQNESLQVLATDIDSHKSADPIIWGDEIALPLNMQPALDRTNSLYTDCSTAEVLLTGATGRLGREILLQLIQCQSIGKVHCVAVRRPEKLLAHQKIYCYQGDLSKSRIGMSQEEELTVFPRCQAIIHCGALVSFVQTYETLRSVNVGSTKYLAAMALKHDTSFHYISTAAVGPEGQDSQIEEASAARSRPPADGVDGYTTTKWASEVFLESMNTNFGLRVTIHRPSNVVCDGDPGMDIVNNLLYYSRRLGSVPQLKGWTGYFDLIGGEIAASNIVQSLLVGTNCTDRNDTKSYQGVQYIHESGGTVFPVTSLGEYLATEKKAPLKTIDMRLWVANSIKKGMTNIVGDYLCDMEESGEKVSLPLIKTSRSAVPR